VRGVYSGPALKNARMQCVCPVANLVKLKSQLALTPGPSV
jgi:hypothetical protein